jgi:hypothetical protein
LWKISPQPLNVQIEEFIQRRGHRWIPTRHKVENELHFLTSCEAYDSIRENFLNSLQNVLPKKTESIGRNNEIKQK